MSCYSWSTTALLVLSSYISLTPCFAAVLVNGSDGFDSLEHERALEKNQATSVGSSVGFIIAQVIWIPCFVYGAYRHCCKRAAADDNSVRSGSIARSIAGPRSVTQNMDRMHVSFGRREHVRSPEAAHRAAACSEKAPNENTIDFVITTLDDGDLLCPICLDSFHANQNSALLPCTHVLHLACLKKWVVKTTKAACPMCRFDLTSHR